jgi:DNA polymerase-3 subunit chi
VSRPLSDAEAEPLAALETVRPALSVPYTRALPGARAAVLTRLWRALAHEPLPWITGRERAYDALVLRLADGRRLHGPPSDPYATGDYVTEVRLDETPYDSPAALLTALGVPHGAAFAAELDAGTASLALSRANREDWAARADRLDRTNRTDRAGRTAAGPSGAPPTPLWAWEQRVVDGHPFHPACRSRPGFSVAEQLAYGPEHRPVVRLGLASVDDCEVTGEWPATLRDGARVLIPVHPWQRAHVLDRRSEVTDDGPVAHPLMSLRTLALPDGGDGGPHVKTTLSARLTSSVRDISPYSVRTAAVVSALVSSVAARTDGLLHVTRTLGAVTTGSPDLAAVLREPPERYAGPGERVLPVAVLPATGLPRSPAWLADFTRLTLTVGLRLLDLGVALEAHGQNLLVVLDAATGAPLRLVYRDLADIRVAPARMARHRLSAGQLTGRLVTDDPTVLRRKLFGSLVAGALAATAGSGAALGEALAAAVPDLPRTPDREVLDRAALPAKALTLMRLTPERTGDLWTSLPNPLHEGVN